jgi:hypothetical protein
MIEVLAEEFNKMSENLRRGLCGLEKGRENRRLAIANEVKEWIS